MKWSRFSRRLVGVISLTLMMHLAFANPVFANPRVKRPAGKPEAHKGLPNESEKATAPAAAQSSPREEVARFGADLTRFVDHVLAKQKSEAAERFGSQGELDKRLEEIALLSKEKIRAAMDSMELITDEALSPIADTLRANRGLLDQLLQTAQNSGRLEKPERKDGSDAASASNAIACGGSCAQDDICLIAVAILNAIVDGMPDELVILGIGAPNPAIIVAAAARLAVEITCQIDECENARDLQCALDTKLANLQTSVNTARTDIINNDNANTTTIVNNDNSNRTTIVNNDNANRTTIVNNDNANTATLNTSITNARTTIVNNDNANKTELRDLILRTQIEADLAEADNATHVAFYLTPNSHGGHLDLVQTIVTQTLANIQAAGGSIGNAQSFLTQANAQKAAGQFKDAYKNYRKAYKAAAN